MGGASVFKVVLARCGQNLVVGCLAKEATDMVMINRGATLPRLVPDRIHNLFAADIDIFANPRNYFKLNQFE